MQPTQPLTPRPSAIQQAPAVSTAPVHTVTTAGAPAADSLVNSLSIAALVAAIAALVTIYLAFQATASS
jgi:hypothetical protein